MTIATVVKRTDKAMRLAERLGATSVRLNAKDMVGGSARLCEAQQHHADRHRPVGRPASIGKSVRPLVIGRVIWPKPRACQSRSLRPTQTGRGNADTGFQRPSSRRDECGRCSCVVRCVAVVIGAACRAHHAASKSVDAVPVRGADMRDSLWHLVGRHCLGLFVLCL